MLLLAIVVKGYKEIYAFRVTSGSQTRFSGVCLVFSTLVMGKPSRDFHSIFSPQKRGISWFSEAFRDHLPREEKGLSNTRDTSSIWSCDTCMDKATRLSPHFDPGCLVKICFLRGHKPGEVCPPHPSLCSHIPSLGALMGTLWGQPSSQHRFTSPSVQGLWERCVYDQANGCLWVLSLLATGLVLLSLHSLSEQGTWLIWGFTCRRPICEHLAMSWLRPNPMGQHLTCWASFQTPQHPFAFHLSAPSNIAQRHNPSFSKQTAAGLLLPFLCTKIHYKASS